MWPLRCFCRRYRQAVADVEWDPGAIYRTSAPSCRASTAPGRGGRGHPGPPCAGGTRAGNRTGRPRGVCSRSIQRRACWASTQRAHARGGPRGASPGTRQLRLMRLEDARRRAHSTLCPCSRSSPPRARQKAALLGESRPRFAPAAPSSSATCSSPRSPRRGDAAGGGRRPPRPPGRSASLARRSGARPARDLGLEGRGCRTRGRSPLRDA